MMTFASPDILVFYHCLQNPAWQACGEMLPNPRLCLRLSSRFLGATGEDAGEDAGLSARLVYSIRLATPLRVSRGTEILRSTRGPQRGLETSDKLDSAASRGG